MPFLAPCNLLERRRVVGGNTLARAAVWKQTLVLCQNEPGLGFSQGREAVEVTAAIASTDVPFVPHRFCL